MKKIAFLLCFLFLLANLSFGQKKIGKVRASEVAFYTDKQWSKYYSCSDLIVTTAVGVNIKNITIYSDPIQQYDMVSEEFHTDADGDNCLRFVAIDESGDECVIQLYPKENDKSMLWIKYKDAAVIYKFEK